jgi:pimeloyl-ACP methyl ester carboxylesterase
VPNLNKHRAGSGPPLVLLHGIGGSWHQWEPVLPALEAEREVLALDLPGFGDSPPTPDPPTIPSQADAVERELDLAGFDIVHLAGNSSGGWLALELGRRGRARSIVAISPAGMWNRFEELRRYWMLRNAHYGARWIARHPALTRTASRRWLLGAWQWMARPGRWTEEQFAQQVRALGRSPSYMDFLRWTQGRNTERLEDVTCPVLIAWGSRDLVLPRRQARRFLERLPNGSFRLLHGVGHVPMADDPELVAQTIFEFSGEAC